MAMIQARNRSSHTYNEKTADELARAILSTFVPEFRVFSDTFSKLEASEP